MSSTAIVIVAAGEGTRLGRGVPKAFATIAGAPLLEHSLRGLAGVEADLVVVVPAGYEKAAQQTATTAGASVTVVAGGITRADSVAAGLAASGTADRILVHDAARALAPRSLVDRVIDALEAGAPAVVPVLPLVDTIRQGTDEALGHIVDRAELRAMQTPQGFDAALLRRAYEVAGESRADSTDDAQLVQALGVGVLPVAGDERAFKITTPADAARAEALLGPSTRVGIGVDVHAFGGDGPLWVAGLEWEGKGLSGHSDGDVVCHAIVDALLGAAGLGDIGGLVGVDDPAHAGAAGVSFIELAVVKLAEHGLRPVNVSVQVLGERPRIGNRRQQAQAVLSEAVGAPVALAATTTDGLGALGRGEGLQAIATALIARR